ncbi:MAG TPA: helix-turn-helix domain-containing protein [Fastidiosipila sp.]|jgi:plasmid maintenance system antidote protein VapI|nr:helix-turn-helix domain-containing protein [Fastidiosipila sp.]
MMLPELLERKNMTLYQLSKISGVPYTTVNDIYHGRTSLDKCTAETVYKLSKAVDLSMEALLSPYFQKRISFELYKSNVCHRLKELGDIKFIMETLKNDDINKLFKRKWYPESLYLLAMLDYLSRENKIPLCTKYEPLRSMKLQETLYPTSVLAMAMTCKSAKIKADIRDQSIPEFLRHNIVENEVRNVI